MVKTLLMMAKELQKKLLRIFLIKALMLSLQEIIFGINKKLQSYIEKENRLLRPANLAEGSPGKRLWNFFIKK